ncbi:hypothetical protein BS78_04G161000 [Paspalum vaginatum]|nr:hypothetical protein BS78_04G161000 [Paspalum vaginatum]
MDEEDDDFTFPTVGDAARAPEGRGGGGDGPVATAHLLLHLPVLPDHPAAAPSPLWPFIAASPWSSVPNKTADEQARPASSGGTTGRVEEPRAAAADEETMDMLWEGATATAAPPSEPDNRDGGGGQAHAEPPKQQQQRRSQAEEDDDTVADAERMDKLWESFNEDPDRWFLCDCSQSTDGAESEEGTCASPAARCGYGCAPAMLRASSRAGGAGQFCRRRGSPRRRGAAAGWALLLRLFRRLFTVDKTSSSRSPRGGGGGIYVP